MRGRRTGLREERLEFLPVSVRRSFDGRARASFLEGVLVLERVRWQTGKPASVARFADSRRGDQ
jgi:hypothetical protein